MFHIKKLCKRLKHLTKGLITMSHVLDTALERISKIQPGLNQSALDAALAPIKADLEALKTAQAADVQKFADIQTAVDANAAGDLTEEAALDAIITALGSPNVDPAPAPAEEGTDTSGETAGTA